MEPKKSMKPMTLSELLPALRGIMSKEDFQMYTEQNRSRPTMLPPRSNEKTYKPLTMAELSSVIPGLNSQSSKKPASSMSAKKKKWNTSVKVEQKKISRTANGQMRHNSVRKVLDMAPNTKIPSTTRIPMNLETPKFPKPEYKAKKSFYLHARNNVRISGICAIPDTPLGNRQTKITRQTVANKENITPVLPKVYVTRTAAFPEVAAEMKVMTPPCDTPQLKETWISSCDDSFLQREKEIQDTEEKPTAISKGGALENVEEKPLPMSTPFKDFRSAKDFFNESARSDNSELYEDNTIMSFDKPTPKENKREESVIVSLCDLLNNANLNNSKNESTELNDLIECQKQSKNNIRLIEQGIETLNKIKQTELRTLETVSKLIEEKNNGRVDNTVNLNKTKNGTVNKSCLVIKRSPTYQIPKKNPSLRKSVISKSMLTVPNIQLSPHGGMNEKALGIYMKMKKHVSFLKTPCKSERETVVHGTPSAAITSLNLQKQLDKLYCE